MLGGSAQTGSSAAVTEQIDLQNAESEVWLAKVPDFLAAEWKKRKADSDSFDDGKAVKLGKVLVTGSLGTATKLAVQCIELPERLPAEYNLVKTNLVQPPHSNRYGMQIGSENTTGGGPQIDGTLMKSFELKWRDSKENREKHKAIQLDRVKKVGAGVVDGRMAAKDTTRNPMDRHMQPKPVAPKEKEPRLMNVRKDAQWVDSEIFKLFDVKIPDGKAPGERFPHLTSSRRQIYLTVPPQGQPGQSKAYYTTAELVEATSQPKFRRCSSH